MTFDWHCKQVHSLYVQAKILQRLASKKIEYRTTLKKAAPERLLRGAVWPSTKQGLLGHCFGATLLCGANLDHRILKMIIREKNDPLFAKGHSFSTLF